MLTFDPSTDFQTFDGQVEVQLQPGPAAAAGAVTVTTDAVRRWITTAEVEASNGRYTSDDVVFHLSGVGLSRRPLVGDTLVEGSNNWTVLTCRHESLTDRWEVVVRQLAVSGVNTVVTVQKASFSTSEDGVQEATWADEHVDLPAAFQLVSGSETEEHGKPEMKPRYRAHLIQTIETRNRRVVHDGTEYRITGHADSDRIDALFTLELEAW